MFSFKTVKGDKNSICNLMCFYKRPQKEGIFAMPLKGSYRDTKIIPHKYFFIKDMNCYPVFSLQYIYTTGPSANLKITIAPALKVRFPPVIRIGLGP